MSDVVVRTDGLRKEYGAAGLHGIDLRVERGTVYGLVGANGAGKTTLLSLLSGMRRPDSGSIELGVEPARVAVCPDVPEFEPWLTAREVVDLAGRLVTADLRAGAVDAALAIAGLADVAGRRVGGFSRGMTQRLAIAATIVADPEVVILDEPSAALDPAGRREVLDLVGRLGRRSTVIFSSHILADVERVADHVGVLADGRMLYQGPLDVLLERHTSPAWVVRVHGEGAAAAVASGLDGQDWVVRADATGPSEVRVEARSLEEGERRLASALGAVGVRVASIEPLSADLEAVFLRLIGDEGAVAKGGAS